MEFYIITERGFDAGYYLIFFCHTSKFIHFRDDRTWGGILLLAFMTPIFPPNVLIPLHGVIQLFSNTSRVALSIKRVDPRIFVLFAIGAGIGSLASVPITVTITSIFSTIILSVAIIFFTWYPKIQKGIDFPGKFLAIGAIASFLSTFVGATGPLTAPFFLNSKLEKDCFVPTKAACQIPIHLFKVIVYMISGFILSEWYLYILIAIPLVILGNYIGKIVTGKLEDKKYRLIVKLVITILVGRMLIRAFL